jgi:hypothetical protein
LHKIEAIYDAYLDKLQEEREKKNKEYKKWFSGSSAGSCYKKQWYKLNGYEPEPFTPRIKRLLRVGTILHKDFEDAIKWHYSNGESDGNTWVDSYTEHEIKIPEINVVGHLDHCTVVRNTTTKVDVYIGDLKTIASYGWTSKFGREAKKRGINVHSTLGHYELQVGTYALGMLLQIAPETFKPMLDVPQMFDKIDEFENDITLNIIWYNKNNSDVNVTQIPNEAIGAALSYWIDLNEFIDDDADPECELDIADIAPEGAIGVPMMDWGYDAKGVPKECNYCQFKKICRGS